MLTQQKRKNQYQRVYGELYAHSSWDQRLFQQRETCSSTKSAALPETQGKRFALQVRLEAAPYTKSLSGFGIRSLRMVKVFFYEP
jgi:hypothetical protein